MNFNKVIYQTDIYDIAIQKYGGNWLLQVTSEFNRLVEWQLFKYYETVDHYVKNKYLGV